MLVRAINVIFGCRHPRITWPRLDRATGLHYVACLQCGARLQYNWQRLGAKNVKAVAGLMPGTAGHAVAVPGQLATKPK